MTTLRVSAIGSLAFAAGLVSSSRAVAQSLTPNGQTISGISCDAMEGQRLHIHQHLVILDHGKPVDIPPNVGQPSGRRCIYWLHTHTPDGFIHVEAPLDRSFTLGDFFTVWGQPLTRTTAASAHLAKGESLKVWLNGEPFAGDPRSIPLTAHADIVIQVGGPHTKPEPVADWGRL